MSKRAIRPQSRRHIFIYDEDWELLDQLYGLTSASRVGIGTVIRELVHAKAIEMRERINLARDERTRQGHQTAENFQTPEAQP